MKLVLVGGHASFGPIFSSRSQEAIALAHTRTTITFLFLFSISRYTLPFWLKNGSSFMLSGYVCQRVVCSYVSVESVFHLDRSSFSPLNSKLPCRMNREHRLETIKKRVYYLPCSVANAGEGEAWCKQATELVDKDAEKGGSLVGSGGVGEG